LVGDEVDTVTTADLTEVDDAAELAADFEDAALTEEAVVDADEAVVEVVLLEDEVELTVEETENYILVKHNARTPILREARSCSQKDCHYTSVTASTRTIRNGDLNSVVTSGGDRVRNRPLEALCGY